MLNWLANHGVGTIAWLNFLAVVIIVLWAAWLAKDVWKIVSSLIKEAGYPDGSRGTWKLFVKSTVVKGFFLVVIIFAFYAAMGPGTPPQELQSDIGVMEYVDKAPDMKTQEQIDKEAAARVDPFLKKQDEGFQAEMEEADAILDEARKRHSNQ